MAVEDLINSVSSAAPERIMKYSSTQYYIDGLICLLPSSEYKLYANACEFYKNLARFYSKL